VPVRNPRIGGAGGTAFGQMRVEIDMGEVDGLLQAGESRRAVGNFLDNASRSVAEEIARLAREKLAVGGEKDIGATGRAAGNIYVIKTGKHDAEIFEGPYPANFYIREGRSKGAKKPPAKAIVDWIVSKGINITKPPDQRGAFRMTKYGGPRANLRSKSPRPWKRDLKQVAGVIANKIAQTGMKHLEPLYPSGQARYDYYGEILSRTPGRVYFDRMVSQGYGAWFTLYTQFVRDGRPRRISRRSFGAEL
jgi:hypothetical protein